jgi:hypothetical protein
MYGLADFEPATMLNAVGRNAFLLYVEASHFEAVDFKDYVRI